MFSRIGYSIARRLAQEGARVMISSRKEDHVKKAVERLQAEKLDIKGMVCHVGKPEHRSKLIEQVR
jgi:dehydrogenase/reductase SDR family protein 4